MVRREGRWILVSVWFVVLFRLGLGKRRFRLVWESVCLLLAVAEYVNMCVNLSMKSVVQSDGFQVPRLGFGVWGMGYWPIST